MGPLMQCHNSTTKSFASPMRNCQFHQQNLPVTSSVGSCQTQEQSVPKITRFGAFHQNTVVFVNSPDVYCI